MLDKIYKTHTKLLHSGNLEAGDAITALPAAKVDLLAQKPQFFSL
jgi:hypothetical protein